MKIWLAFILVSVVVSSCTSFPDYAPRSLQGNVPLSPEEPDVLRPVDFLFCESDADCTTTIFRADACCTSCSHAVSVVGKVYLEEWDGLNCQEPYSRESCISAECSDVNRSTIRCENNGCVVDLNN